MKRRRENKKKRRRRRRRRRKRRFSKGRINSQTWGGKLEHQTAAT